MYFGGTLLAGSVTKAFQAADHLLASALIIDLVASCEFIPITGHKSAFGYFSTLLVIECCKYNEYDLNSATFLCRTM